MTKKELGEEARRLRKAAGMTWEGAALVSGTPIGSLSRIEKGEASIERLETYVEMLKTMGAEGIRAKYAELSGAATEIDTADKVKAVVEGEKKAKKAKAPAGPKSAIAKEIDSFARRHDMRSEDLADTLGLSTATVRMIRSGRGVPSLDLVTRAREAMGWYESDKRASSKQFTPPMPVIPAAPVPTAKIKLVTGEGIRLNNGDNLAPVLKLDGTTLHVFTLVPGGVFVSYVTAELE